MFNLKKFIFIFSMGILGIVFYCKYHIGIPCFFYEITGWYCPGCGITRAVFSLLQLDIYQAFRYNMLVVVLLPILLAYVIYKVIFKGSKKIPNAAWYFLLIFTICFGIFRNIPCLSFLAPTII